MRARGRPVHRQNLRGAKTRCSRTCTAQPPPFELFHSPKAHSRILTARGKVTPVRRETTTRDAVVVSVQSVSRIQYLFAPCRVLRCAVTNIASAVIATKGSSCTLISDIGTDAPWRCILRHCTRKVFTGFIFKPQHQGTIGTMLIVTAFTLRTGVALTACATAEPTVCCAGRVGYSRTGTDNVGVRDTDCTITSSTAACAAAQVAT